CAGADLPPLQVPDRRPRRGIGRENFLLRSLRPAQRRQWCPRPGVSDRIETGTPSSCQSSLERLLLNIPMASRLQGEIHKTSRFASVEQEAFLNVMRSAQVLGDAMAELLKPTGISPTQYNVLRILRGAGPEGLACREVAGRMVTRDPDITRLLDRL